RGEGAPRGYPVVTVRAAEVVGAVRVHRDDQVRAPAADLPGDAAAEIAGLLALAVGVAEELDARDAKRTGRVALFLGADHRQALRRHRAVARALVAVGHDHVRDLAPLLDQLGDSPTGSELGIVRMRRDHQDALDLVGQ